MVLEEELAGAPPLARAAQLLLEDDRAQRGAAAATADPARIEIFNNLFMHIAEQMGEVLKATAQSVNIRERLDYSCALFDAHGALVANAPHMPVHLGSMGASVRAVIRARSGRHRAGDSWLLNSPYHGGTHLPDMTVVTPVFLAGREQPDFFVASRAHHADIGGMTPGSMPPFSRSIEEEGVLFECFQLVERGTLREGECGRARRRAAGRRAIPSRMSPICARSSPPTRAASRRSARRQPSRPHTVHATWSRAGECRQLRARAIADSRPGVPLRARQRPVIAVRIDIDLAQHRARWISPAPPGRARTTSTHRCGVHGRGAVCIPHAGRGADTAQRRLPRAARDPDPARLDARSALPAAVAAGNVETSQCIVDTLYGALGVLAASQGTMNNLTFGDARLQYYETICGGAGAGADFDGALLCRRHMTNSRLTDPEILEAEFPVLVASSRSAVAPAVPDATTAVTGRCAGSASAAPFSGALLANHRRIAPLALPVLRTARQGRQIRRVDGKVESLGATARFEVAPGDELTILTPGGGGFGSS